MVKAGYKQTEIGEIPEDWSVRPIGSSFDFKNGLNKAKQFFGYGTPIVNYMDVFNNSELIASDIVGKVDVSNDELRNFSAKFGDVFFTRTSETVDEIGTAAALVDELNNAVFSGFVLRARPKDDAFQINFRSYCFQSFIVRTQIQSTASYTTRALTNGRLLSDVLVPIPQKPEEQNAIATALSDVDGLIGALEKQIAKKRDIKTATMQQLLTGKKRLPGFGEGKGYKQTELGLIPEDWEITFLKDTCQSFKTGKLDANAMKVDGQYRFYTCAKNYSWIDVYAFDDEALLVSGNGANVGYVHYYKGKFNAYQRTYVLTDFSANIAFLKLYLERSLAERIRVEVNAGNTPYITMGTLTDMRLPLPQEEKEQEAIASILLTIDNELEFLAAKLSKTKAIKQGMMQELLTGRTRLV